MSSTLGPSALSLLNSPKKLSVNSVAVGDLRVRVADRSVREGPRGRAEGTKASTTENRGTWNRMKATSPPAGRDSTIVLPCGCVLV